MRFDESVGWLYDTLCVTIECFAPILIMAGRDAEIFIVTKQRRDVSEIQPLNSHADLPTEAI